MAKGNSQSAVFDAGLRSVKIRKREKKMGERISVTKLVDLQCFCHCPYSSLIGIRD